jgi:hypothetical protein
MREMLSYEPQLPGARELRTQSRRCGTRTKWTRSQLLGTLSSRKNSTRWSSTGEPSAQRKARDASTRSSLSSAPGALGPCGRLSTATMKPLTCCHRLVEMNIQRSQRLPLLSERPRPTALALGFPNGSGTAPLSNVGPVALNLLALEPNWWPWLVLGHRRILVVRTSFVHPRSAGGGTRRIAIPRSSGLADPDLALH